MIISHKHKFIFIKTLKTGGTSLESFLASYCGKKDIVTSVDPRDEFTRRQLGIFPRNNLKFKKYGIPEEKDVSFKSLKDLINFRTKHRYAPSKPNFEKERVLFTNHTRADKIKKHVPATIWDSYYKFCFDRNPWDRVISSFYFAPLNRHIKMTTNDEIHSYLKERLNKNAKFCNSSFYTDSQGEVIVDDVFDYDNFDDAVSHLCNKLGFDFGKFKAMPRMKSTTREDRRPYEEFLTQETIDFIADIKNAIDIMGFKALPSKV